MHTVSLFPAFFDYQMLGIFMLRVTLGFILVHFWYTQITHQKTEFFHFFETFGRRRARTYSIALSSLFGIAGSLLVAGLYTQAVGIAIGVVSSILAFIKWRKPRILPHTTTEFYVLLAVISLSLLFLGPGAFAIDLPL